jgi:hypothetical protein
VATTSSSARPWIGIDELGERRVRGFERMRELEHRRGNRDRLRAREAHHSDASAARRSGDGDDGVVEVHSAWTLVHASTPMPQ